MKKITLLLCALFFAGAVQADVQIRIKDGNGSVSTISSNGQQTRIEDGSMMGYVIIDYVSGEYLMVDTANKEVLKSKIATGGKTAAVGEPLDISLKKQGSGPKIAGYATQHYRLLANGENCGSVYASKQLLDNSDIRGLFDSMRKMRQQSRGMMGGMSNFMSRCEQAGLQLHDAIESSGAPLRVVDASGKLQSEVLAVDTGKKFSSGHYRAPEGMKVVGMDQKMNQAAQQSGKAMENMPDMNQMMEQMQQGGGQMTEEMKQQMQQQMKKMQQMLQQLQQQQQ